MSTQEIDSSQFPFDSVIVDGFDSVIVDGFDSVIVDFFDETSTSPSQGPYLSVAHVWEWAKPRQMLFVDR